MADEVAVLEKNFQLTESAIPGLHRLYSRLVAHDHASKGQVPVMLSGEGERDMHTHDDDHDDDADPSPHPNKHSEDDAALERSRSTRSVSLMIEELEKHVCHLLAFPSPGDVTSMAMDLQSSVVALARSGSGPEVGLSWHTLNTSSDSSQSDCSKIKPTPSYQDDDDDDMVRSAIKPTENTDSAGEEPPPGDRASGDRASGGGFVHSDFEPDIPVFHVALTNRQWSYSRRKREEEE
eukprot:CAMPEP_0185783838 /NCGR_PEP_ID=MMETSP1174-20130828/119280_1 /TAXON_ID=35687 /ORGANISM="Dictyocha speculum, Strain CCMP1381" /LENGTH=235 /DNA_ID=CAMNT_0028475077 /DNA_START=47 /DNA_END=751 /DNA_ORIENTATION=-